MYHGVIKSLLKFIELKRKKKVISSHLFADEYILHNVTIMHNL